MKENKQLQVKYKGKQVGTLALNNQDKVAFQYTDAWLKDGFSISPFSLPLKEGVFVPKNYTFDGLFGVFADSLPDAWGRVVLDRMLKSKGINIASINVLDRLAIVGSSGMGALEYYPESSFKMFPNSLDIDTLAGECEKLMNSEEINNIDVLFDCCGSSGGARPKALITIENEEWIVKFRYRYDGENAGEKEYKYSLIAKECGIHMPVARLLPSLNTTGYFAVKRFDRPKRHMISAAALLEIDFERSCSDYAQLFKLTNILTNGNKEDMKDMFRRMCFNVYGENQDDHLKNFAYLYNDSLGVWELSPAFDLTHCISGFGEHTTTVNGKGKDITAKDLIKVGTSAGLGPDFCAGTERLVYEVFQEWMQ